MKVMISQPMNGLSDIEIEEVRKRAVSFLEANGHEVVNTFFEEIPENGITTLGVYFLAKSLAAMSECHAVYFCEGWKNTRGCCLEHQIATEYLIPTMYEPRQRKSRKTPDNLLSAE